MCACVFVNSKDKYFKGDCIHQTVMNCFFNVIISFLVIAWFSVIRPSTLNNLYHSSHQSLMIEAKKVFETLNFYSTLKHATTQYDFFVFGNMNT
jgi:hypothetical protein